MAIINSYLACFFVLFIFLYDNDIAIRCMWAFGLTFVFWWESCTMDELFATLGSFNWAIRILKMHKGRLKQRLTLIKEFVNSNRTINTNHMEASKELQSQCLAFVSQWLAKSSLEWITGLLGRDRERKHKPITSYSRIAPKKPSQTPQCFKKWLTRKLSLLWLGVLLPKIGQIQVFTLDR